MNQLAQVLDLRNKIAEAQKRKQLIENPVFVQTHFSGELQEVHQQQVQPLNNYEEPHPQLYEIADEKTSPTVSIEPMA